MTLKQAVALAALSLLTLAPLTASAQSFTYTGGTGGDPPDNNAAGVSSTINVSDNFVLTEFTSITINGFAHSYLGDLIVTLSHGGKTVDIIDRVAASQNDSSNLSGNYTFVTTGGANFGAAAAALGDNGIVSSGVSYATVPVGTTPTDGFSSANGLLSDFAGLNVSGAWTLNVSDRRATNTGFFSGWRFVVADPSFINANRTVSDASLNGFSTVRVVNGADATLAAGAVVQNVQAFNNSRVVVSGGAATSLRAEDTAKLYLNYGTVSGAVTATENSTAFVNGGTVGSVVTEGNAVAYVLAGTFGSVSASGTSDIFIYGGGSAGAVFGAIGGASISLFGDNLVLDFASRTAGMDAFGNLGTFYNLSGTLTDGTSLLGTRFFDADGGFSVVGENPGALFFNGVAVVPESGTFSLLLAGFSLLVGVVTRRNCLAR